jgi:transcription initiation factor TFIID subunit TAF12
VALGLDQLVSAPTDGVRQQQCKVFQLSQGHVQRNAVRTALDREFCFLAMSLHFNFETIDLHGHLLEQKIRLDRHAAALRF